MSDGFVMQKGAAVTAATHPGDAARFHARRTIMLPAINLHASAVQADAPLARRPSRAAQLDGTTAAEKRKFTFRIDAARHAAFCQAAESRNVSRQRLLTEALDDLLRRTGHTADMAPTHPEERQAPHANRVTPRGLDLTAHRA